MRLDDVNKLFEEAFAKVEPVDDAHREKLDKMRAKILESNAEMAKEIGGAMSLVDNLVNTDQDKAEHLVEERDRIAKETLDAMSVAFSEHAELIDRIAHSSD
jgi:uncharacterized membrane-anchored protein YhcB (DUF1043 family)